MDTWKNSRKRMIWLKIRSHRGSMVLAALLLLALSTMLYYGSKKEGYHVDEVYSYGLANSEYLPFMHFGEQVYSVKDWMLEYGSGESLSDLFRNFGKDYQILKDCDFQWKESVIYRDYLTAQANSADTRSSTWLSGQDYLNYIAVSQSNTFNYASVYYNQRGDVHPPLYYMALHTVCSFFQGVFSPWFGLCVNITFLLLTLVVLNRMVKTYLGGEAVALAVMAAYGLSCGMLTTAMYLRMYALMTLMVMCCCAVHLRIFAEDFRIRGKNGVLLVLAVLGGYMTHYYFVLYAIGVAVVFIVVMAIRKRWSAILRYILLLSLAAAIGLCIWPFAIKHVFHGYRGTAAIDVISSGHFYLIKIRLMLQQIIAQTLGGQTWILWLVLAVLVAVCIWKRGEKLALAKGALVFLPIYFYIVEVSQIVPFFVERYVMCTFPFFCLFVVGGASYCAKIVLRGSWLKGCAAVAGVAVVLMNNAYLHVPSYLYMGGQQTVVLPENTDCIYVLPDGDWNESAVDSTILAQCRNVAVAYHSSLPSLAESYEYKSGDAVLVAIQQDMDVVAVLQEVRELFGIEGLVEVERQQGSTAVRILLSEKANL